jgi:hypothetical protein
MRECPQQARPGVPRSAVLSKLAVDQTAKLRLAIFPETRGSSEEAAP